MFTGCLYTSKSQFFTLGDVTVVIGAELDFSHSMYIYEVEKSGSAQPSFYSK